jgi:hypothetical protein
MPSTVRQTSVEALALVVAAEDPDEVVEALADPAELFAAGGPDSPHPAKATLSAMKTGAER